MASVITLTTDFGTGDAYVASMKGVVLTINPAAIIVDISHSVEPQNVLQVAFIVGTAHHYFPKGTIHVVVVDPGVGSQRQAVILKTPSAFFIAPDNGALSYILDDPATTPAKPPLHFPTNVEQRELGASVEAIAITKPDFWRQPVSPTFHGRDIFAPVAAHLSLGVPLSRFGDSVNRLNAFPIARPYQNGEGNLIGHVLHIDSFGNLITDIRNGDLPTGELVIEIGNHRMRGLSQFYSQADGLLAIIGSSGHLEISLRNGNAAAFLGTKVGDEIRLKTSNKGERE